MYPFYMRENKAFLRNIIMSPDFIIKSNFENYYYN